MRVFNSSLLLKTSALLRFLTLRCFFYRKIKIRKLSYLGKKLKIIVSKRGSIIINGKIRIIDYVELQSDGELLIGNGCGINSFSRIIAFNKIILGDNVSIAQFVSILDHDHSFVLKNNKIDFSGFTTSPIVIGNNVWIGDKVTITKGVKIGDNVVIGANSVVTKDIPSNSLAGGIPARVIREIVES